MSILLEAFINDVKKLDDGDAEVFLETLADQVIEFDNNGNEAVSDIFSKLLVVLESHGVSM